MHDWPFLFNLVLWGTSSCCPFPDILACGKIVSPGALTVSKAFVFQPPNFISGMVDSYFHSFGDYVLRGDLCTSWHLVTWAQENKDSPFFLWDLDPFVYFGGWALEGGVPTNRWKMKWTERLFRDKLLQGTHKAGTPVPSFGVSGWGGMLEPQLLLIWLTMKNSPFWNACLLRVTWVLQLNPPFSNLAVFYMQSILSQIHVSSEYLNFNRLSYNKKRLVFFSWNREGLPVGQRESEYFISSIVQWFFFLIILFSGSRQFEM